MNRSNSAAKIGGPHEHGTTPSLIKPYLHKLAGSASNLNGIIVEPDLEGPGSDADIGPVRSPKHLAVLHSGAPAKLEWTLQGMRRQALFSEDDVIINPAGLFTYPRWDSEVELVLFAVSPAVLDRVAEQMDGRPDVELVPRFGIRDELLKQLASALIREFELTVQPDRVYAESLAHAFVPHLLKKHSAAGLRQFPLKRGLQRRTLAPGHRPYER